MSKGVKMRQRRRENENVKVESSEVEDNIWRNVSVKPKDELKLATFLKPYLENKKVLWIGHYDIPIAFLSDVLGDSTFYLTHLEGRKKYDSIRARRLRGKSFRVKADSFDLVVMTSCDFLIHFDAEMRDQIFASINEEGSFFGPLPKDNEEFEKEVQQEFLFKRYYGEAERGVNIFADLVNEPKTIISDDTLVSDVTMLRQWIAAGDLWKNTDDYVMVQHPKEVIQIEKKTEEESNLEENLELETRLHQSGKEIAELEKELVQSQHLVRELIERLDGDINESTKSSVDLDDLTQSLTSNFEKSELEARIAELENFIIPQLINQNEELQHKKDNDSSLNKLSELEGENAGLRMKLLNLEAALNENKRDSLVENLKNVEGVKDPAQLYMEIEKLQTENHELMISYSDKENAFEKLELQLRNTASAMSAKDALIHRLQRDIRGFERENEHDLEVIQSCREENERLKEAVMESSELVDERDQLLKEIQELKKGEHVDSAALETLEDVKNSLEGLRGDTIPSFNDESEEVIKELRAELKLRDEELFNLQKRVDSESAERPKDPFVEMYEKELELQKESLLKAYEEITNLKNLYEKQEALIKNISQEALNVHEAQESQRALLKIQSLINR